MDQHLVTLLELVRVEGIVKMLLDNIDHDELTETVHQVLQNENDNIKAELDRMTRYQLIQVADHHLDVITAELVNQYYEQYRYGLKPGFTLYLLCGPQADITAEQAFTQLQMRLEAIPDIFPNARCAENSHICIVYIVIHLKSRLINRGNCTARRVVRF